MVFDPDNAVVKLCLDGITSRDLSAKNVLIQEAWNLASNSEEKCLAAHYMGRLFVDLNERMKWDNDALEFAKQLPHETIAGFYPILYLMIGKNYEDMGLKLKASEYYQNAYSAAIGLPNDNYGKTTKKKVVTALERLLNKE
jgi:hypothetical protein